MQTTTIEQALVLTPGLPVLRITGIIKKVFKHSVLPSKKADKPDGSVQNIVITENGAEITCCLWDRPQMYENEVKGKRITVEAIQAAKGKKWIGCETESHEYDGTVSNRLKVKSSAMITFEGQASNGGGHSAPAQRQAAAPVPANHGKPPEPVGDEAVYFAVINDPHNPERWPASYLQKRVNGGWDGPLVKQGETDWQSPAFYGITKQAAPTPPPPRAAAPPPYTPPAPPAPKAPPIPPADHPAAQDYPPDDHGHDDRQPTEADEKRFTVAAAKGVGRYGNAYKICLARACSVAGWFEVKYDAAMPNEQVCAMATTFFIQGQRDNLFVRLPDMKDVADLIASLRVEPKSTVADLKAVGSHAGPASPNLL